MRRHTVNAWPLCFAPLLAILAGCPPIESSGSTSARPAPSTSSSGGTLTELQQAAIDRKRLQEENQRLKAEAEILDRRVQELQVRYQALVEKYDDLELAERQQKRIIATLRKAPHERDEYKAEVERLRERVEQLSAENARLQKQLSEWQAEP